VALVDTWQVKGLEYDGCVVVMPELVIEEALNEVAGLRTLYVALTRATQRLVVVSGHSEAWLD
ncbi:MAG: putative helicase protein, partial [Frankiales bacterium]|nr:putative helicase protein [Frankiales bacterium]